MAPRVLNLDSTQKRVVI